MIHQTMCLVIFILFAGIFGCSESNSEDKLIAKIYNSGFDHAHDIYNAISRTNDGNIQGSSLYFFIWNNENVALNKYYCYNIQNLASI